MAGDRPRREWWQPSTLQMMKLVAFGAVGLAVVAPVAGLVDDRAATWTTVGAWSCLAVPLSWAGLALVIVRPGPPRDWAILALLTPPVLGTISLVAFLAWVLATGRSPPDPDGPFRMLVGGAMFTALLVGVLGFLLYRLIPGRCPACRRRMALRAGSTGGPVGRPLGECLACGARAWMPGRDWELHPSGSSS